MGEPETWDLAHYLCGYVVSHIPARTHTHTHLHILIQIYIFEIDVKYRVGTLMIINSQNQQVEMPSTEGSLKSFIGSVGVDLLLLLVKA